MRLQSWDFALSLPCPLGVAFACLLQVEQLRPNLLVSLHEAIAN